MDTEMLDRAGLTPAQAQAVLGFVAHNVGNAICGVLSLCDVADKIEPAALQEAASAARDRYREIIDNLRERANGDCPHKGGAAAREQCSKATGIMETLCPNE